MRRASKRCSTPGCVNKAGPQGYCVEVHAARFEAARRRTVPTKRARTQAVRQHRTAAVRGHLNAHQGRGYCPGYGVPPHEVDPKDLTADDPTPIARGGDPMQPLEILCRSCNSRKAAR